MMLKDINNWKDALCGSKKIKIATKLWFQL